MNLLFWYQFFCGFSGTSMAGYWVLIFFNLLFTSAPPVIYGVLEKDVSAEMLLQLPELYRSGQRSEVGATAALCRLITHPLSKPGHFPVRPAQVWSCIENDLNVCVFPKISCYTADGKFLASETNTHKSMKDLRCT